MSYPAIRRVLGAAVLTAALVAAPAAAFAAAPVSSPVVLPGQATEIAQDRFAPELPAEESNSNDNSYSGAGAESAPAAENAPAAAANSRAANAANNGNGAAAANGKGNAAYGKLCVAPNAKGNKGKPNFGCCKTTPVWSHGGGNKTGNPHVACEGNLQFASTAELSLASTGQAPLGLAALALAVLGSGVALVARRRLVATN